MSYLAYAKNPLTGEVMSVNARCEAEARSYLGTGWRFLEIRPAQPQPGKANHRAAADQHIGGHRFGPQVRP